MRASIAALLVLGACERGPAKTEPPPPNLIVDVARASSTSLDGVRAFVNAIQPGAGVMLDEARLLRPLDGMDLTKPMHVLIVDRGDERGIVVLAKIGDSKVVDSVQSKVTIERRNGWAVIGKQPFLRDVASYALSTLATAPAPAVPTAIVYLPRVLALHPKELELAREQFAGGTAGEMSELMKRYYDGLLSVARDTEELRVTLAASAEQIGLDFAFVPKPKSRLATFIAAQHASDFGLLSKLPDGTASMFIAGRIALGPYHDAFVAAMGTLYRIPSGDLTKELETIMNASTGEIAMAVQMSTQGLAMTQLVALADPAAASAALGRVHDKIGAGMKLDLGQASAMFKAVTPPLEHDGVTLRRLDVAYDVQSAPAEQRQALSAMMPPGGVQHEAIGTFDKLLVFAMGADTGAAARTIDAARGKGSHFSPTPQVSTLLDTARKAGDSVAMIFDLSTIVGFLRGTEGTPTPLLFSLGGAGGKFHLRMVATATSIRALVPQR